MSSVILKFLGTDAGLLVVGAVITALGKLFQVNSKKSAAAAKRAADLIRLAHVAFDFAESVKGKTGAQKLEIFLNTLGGRLGAEKLAPLTPEEKADMIDTFAPLMAKAIKA